MAKQAEIPGAPRGLRRVRALREIGNLGLGNWLAFKYHKKRQNRGRGGLKDVEVLGSRYLAHPLCFRPGTSDLYAYRQVFAEREYGCLDDCLDPQLIIDCGANVGYASAYFLSRFPSARLIAVEPDAANFALLTRNLAPYGDRATAVRAAVWPRRTGLVMTAESTGPGQEWGRQVRPVEPGETATIEAVEIGDLFRQTGLPAISILKIDVEGSETAIFSESCRSWIGKVDNLVIELHGRACEDVFFRAIETIPFAVSRSGELTVCRKS